MRGDDLFCLTGRGCLPLAYSTIDYSSTGLCFPQGILRSTQFWVIYGTMKILVSKTQPMCRLFVASLDIIKQLDRKQPHRH